MSDWMIQIPVDALAQLQHLPEEMNALKEDNRKLRSELLAVRNLYSQLLQAVSDAKRERKES